MPGLEPSDYSPVVAALLGRLPLAPLGPGKPRPEDRAQLEALTDAAIRERVEDREMAACCRAGLWLAFDYLDESHTISQEINSVEGSAWHAILHRREPDPDNSKYWWRRVGSHPVLQQLVEQAPAFGYKFTDPFAFVDFVEMVRGTGSADEDLAKWVQKLEWELLFAWCFHRVLSK